MAVGDRNKNGTPKDLVRHYGNQKDSDGSYLLAICGNKRAGYVTDDIKDVTCIKCTDSLVKIMHSIIKAKATL